MTPARKRETPSIRIGGSVAEIREAILENLTCIQGRFIPVATLNDYYLAAAYTVRDRILSRWAKTAQTYYRKESRTVCYFSAEFLLGPQLENHLINLGLYEETKKALEELGLDFTELVNQEEEPGLGNGGLGRLAACYLDSLATLDIPTIGYGIRYEFGIFDQEIRNGWQHEVPDQWLRHGNPWEVARPEIVYEIPFGGRTEWVTNADGSYVVKWQPDHKVRGVAYDTMITGFGSETVIMLRLFRAEAATSLDLRYFNAGDYYRAVHEKIASENLTKVLYPNDEPLAGRRLRLMQQFFLVSCALQDMLRIYFQREQTLDRFSEKYAVQLNDTHPALGIAELVRLLVDCHGMGWENAWEITAKIFNYTNHTLLPEALERWPVSLFQDLLPRHLEIIYEINRRFLDEVRKDHPGDEGLARRLSLIDEEGGRYVRMANLACVGSRHINGVARLHTELLRSSVLADFNRIMPEKFLNVTNGVTPRRFLLLSNPGLAALISERIGREWIRDLSHLRELEPLAEDPSFLEYWGKVKGRNKERLAKIILARTGIETDQNSLFDIQVKRIHEYKRQHLNLLHVISLYNRILHGTAKDMPPRTVIFGGKAAPAYRMAKLIIKAINSVAEAINCDPRIEGMLRVVFLPDFNVKNAHFVYPAADLSEQISLAGKEASGTGNMKFSMNGALTIGTLDGANVEIRQEVGAENFFLFGLTAAEVEETKRRGYRPEEAITANRELREALDMLGEGFFSRGDRELFQPLVRSLRERDQYLLCADYPSYVQAQERVSRTYLSQKDWLRMSVLNVSRMGRFSSDRAIREYCCHIWNISAVDIC
ncbi:MAG: glycogen/starch/alpha-glucan phosphorylase [Desulfobacteraceae bacterium]|nr:MAG: glycogen/starch/alpha-glucan phosphorylase [Desulfobacteraceae bacterium]